MHVTVIYDGIPNDATGGGAFTIFSIAKTLVESGHRVSAVLTLPAQPLNETEQSRLVVFRSIVSQVSVVNQPVTHISWLQKIVDKFSWSLVSTYPEYRMSERVRQMVEDEIHPDVVFIYHFQALAAAYTITKVPKMAIVGDPQFSVMSFRFAHFLRVFSWRHILLLPFFPLMYIRNKKWDVELLKSCQAYGAFAAHHAAELKQFGAIHCEYYRTPIVDPLTVENKKYIFHEATIPRPKFKILLLGHLKGVVSLTGIELFARDILPHLVQEIGTENFVVSIVGDYFDSLPSVIQEQLTSCPAVNVKGYLKNIDEELFSSDIFLIPAPIRLGIRVRAITGFSYGRCMVVHTANVGGIPELKDQDNCLLGDSGKELAQKIINCYHKQYDGEVIGQNARRTFDTYFIPAVTVGVITSALDKLVHNPSRS